MSPKDAFMNTYRLPGGARAFWLMVGGCALALIFPCVLRGDTLRLLSSMISATLALINGQQFTSTFSQFMLENQKINRKGK